MDSLTHLALGALIGEATLGKKAGRKAMLWGAAAGVAPDIDVFLGMFMGDIDKIIFHRGITHSFFLLTLISPLYGWIVSRLERKIDYNWKQWAFMIWLSQLAHVLLDSFTSYGTQIYLPFLADAIAISSISVIDPIFSISLFMAVVYLLLKYSKVTVPKRARIAFIAILISCLYLFATLVNKLQVEQKFLKAWEDKQLEISHFEIKPTLFNNILWRGIGRVADSDSYLVGYYSIADGQSKIRFEWVDGQHHFLDDVAEKPALNRLKWVSQGFYKITLNDDGFLVFNDLRFGRVAEFSDEIDSPYAFSYTMIANMEENDFDVERIRLRIEGDRERGSFRKLWNRMFGLEN
ncbi:MAG: metal-dependent hydrolase [Balneolales bacterium]|nr:metal-dependent hydrolase [Balneolales bacterium]